MVMSEIGSDLWQFHDWQIFNWPKELSHVKVPEKEFFHWIFNPRKHLQSVWGGKILVGYDFWETHILWLLSPSSVSNNVKETYGVPPGSSRFLAYVTLPEFLAGTVHWIWIDDESNIVIVHRVFLSHTNIRGWILCAGLLYATVERM